jgi:GTP-binding protein
MPSHDSSLLPPLIDAVFVTGAAQWSQLPPAGPPEIAFAGRSNAGKSKAINALARRSRLAFSSKTPGRTQQINFFKLRSGALAVDLPGYGFAAVERKTKENWQDFLWRYVTERPTLVSLVLLADSRLGLTDLDYPILDVFLSSARPVMVLATKADKLNRQEQRQAVARIQQQLADRYQERSLQVRVMAFSAVSKLGVDNADQIINEWLS